MSATLYTTTENIRAALGVSDRELSETVMLGLQLDLQLETALDIFVPTHAAIALAGAGAAEGSPEKKLWNQLQLLAQYEGAVILLDNLQLWSAQKISDGDAEMQRFSKDDLETLRINITERRNFYAGRVNAELLVTAPMQHLTRAAPGYDPVTNEG